MPQTTADWSRKRARRRARGAATQAHPTGRDSEEICAACRFLFGSVTGPVNGHLRVLVAFWSCIASTIAAHGAALDAVGAAPDRRLRRL